MKILVIRYGAIGDSIIITPFLRFLKAQGDEVVLHTSETGMAVLANCPYVDQFIPYKSNSVPDDKLQEHWQMLKQHLNCDKMINLCESIERSLSCHPMDPFYNLSKAERRERCNKNFYEYTFTHSGFTSEKTSEKQTVFIDTATSEKTSEIFIPELFFSEEEETEMRKWFEQFRKRFVILWGLSGSALQKCYPYTDYVMAEILRDHKDVVFITIGDELCRALEHKDKRVINRSGVWDIRKAMLATKYADLVVAPDTGILHASGCYSTPKIGLIGHNTIENITKHFVNDFSLEADPNDAPCAPCFRLIYKASTQCPVDPLSFIPVCMSKGIRPERVKNQIELIMKQFGAKNEHSGNDITLSRV